MAGMHRGTVTGGNHYMVREGLRILRGVETALDWRAEVLTPVHLKEEVDSQVVLIFRAKETPAVQVHSFVAGATPVILASVREKTEHVILAKNRA